MRKAFAIPVAIGGLVLGACEPGEPGIDEFPECRTTECDPLKAAPGILTIENRSGAPVEIGIANREGVRLDRRVVNGSLSLPIPVITDDGFARTISLEADGTTSLDDVITVVDGETVGDRFGAFLRVGGGAPVVALGMGRLFVRASSDGTPFLEAEDPKVISITPTTLTVAECGPGILSAPFPPPPASFLDAMRKRYGEQYVRGVVRGIDGCRDIDIANDDGDAVATIHACLPDEAYPFVDGEDVRVFASGDPTTSSTTAVSANMPLSATSAITASMRFVAQSGAELILSRVIFGGRTSSDVDGLTLTLAPDDACVHVDPRCGHVDVPVRMTTRTSDGTEASVVLGRPIADPVEPRTFYVLAGSARPIAATGCTGDDDPGAMSPGRAWVATVQRPK